MQPDKGFESLNKLTVRSGLPSTWFLRQALRYQVGKNGFENIFKIKISLKI